MANIVSPSEVVVVSTFHVELDGGGGDMHVTFPYSMIEPIREVLDNGMQSDVDEVDDRWINNLRKDVLSSTVKLDCRYIRQQVSLRDILDLKPGDVIPVDMPEHVVLQANGVPIFNTKLGVLRGNLALQIESPYGRDDTEAAKKLRTKK
jgi:flagellar motor switch protein FliM